MKISFFLIIYPLLSCFFVHGNNLFAEAMDTNESFIEQEVIDQEQKKIDTGACVQVRQAKIVCLNKVTTKREVLTVSSDSEICIGRLTIKLLECWKMLDPIRPDNLIFLEIYEGKKNKEQLLIFRGWMSEANPGYATLEHYAYAFAVLECF